jgi:two-component system, NtrC family, response regulator AtoC
VIRRALDLSRFRLENRFLREETRGGGPFGELVGSSAAIVSVFELVRQVAPTRSSVLVTGETGTGKELVARAIHSSSRRGRRSCSSRSTAPRSPPIFSRALFGHARGAFSGAHADRVGKFQATDEGTLFLDEIGDMDVRLQAKLLRVLQEGIIEPLGTNRRIPVDVRIVSSTNRDLEAAMREGRFREDLYFRLNVFQLKLPPLRERTADVALLAETFLAGFARDLGKPALRLAPEAVPMLQAYAWPGNVRELRNLMERATVLSRGEVVGPSLIGSLVRTETEPRRAERDDLNLQRALAGLERRMILDALAATDDDKSAAAKLLGIGDRTLWTKLKKHGF